MAWKRFYIPFSQIVVGSKKATLIKMPKESKYSGLSFWYSKKLLFSWGEDTLVLSCNKETTFRLHFEGEYSRSDYIEIGFDEFEEAFEAFSEKTQKKS